MLFLVFQVLVQAEFLVDPVVDDCVNEQQDDEGQHCPLRSHEIMERHSIDVEARQFLREHDDPERCRKPDQ